MRNHGESSISQTDFIGIFNDISKILIRNLIAIDILYNAYFAVFLLAQTLDEVQVILVVLHAAAALGVRWRQVCCRLIVKEQH